MTGKLLKSKGEELKENDNLKSEEDEDDYGD